MRPPFIWTRIEPVEHLPYPERRRSGGFLASGVLALLWIFGWACVILMMTGCVQTEVVRKLPDGGEERTKSYGLTDRAFGALDAGARYYLRVPAEPERSGK